jgi:membrane-bound lytic murein transglycosylase B
MAGLMVISLAICPRIARSVDFTQYPALTDMVNEMVANDGFTRAELDVVLKDAKIDQKTLELMDRQYEALPWHKYRKIFINQNRIDAGVKFWKTNQATLDRAYEKYGVPPAVVVALIGIETHYGVRMGSKRVLDSLVTLSAEYPRRSSYFTAELRKFLNITRAENIAPASVVGSFAGAIGIPQFMPSSYEAYSVDFNDNGQRDLVNEVEDAIGSVANYLKSHGWKRNQRIYADVTEPLSESAARMVSRKAKPTHTPEQLLEAGVKFNPNGSSAKAALLSLKDVQGPRYIVGYKNFYAITRYNTSVNYALAASELADSVFRARNN